MDSLEIAPNRRYHFLFAEHQEAAARPDTFHNACLLKMMGNGRASYVYWEEMVRRLFGLTQARGSDHQDADGRLYEQKSYVDARVIPRESYHFHTAASRTFGANNDGPKVKALLATGDYPAALALCKESGYSKNDFYVYTNTGTMAVGTPLEVTFLKSQEVVDHLSPTDPRLLSRATLLNLASLKEYYWVEGETLEALTEEEFLNHSQV